jgi:hypothetical protein
VTWRRALALASGLAGAAAPAARLRAQVLPAHPARYLLSAEATDARALWVNPAGLGRRLEASLGADVGADRFASGMALSEYGLTIASRGLGISWLHERYPLGLSLNAYAVGLGLGDEQFSAGAARRWYRGLVSGSAWDLGARGAVGESGQLSFVARGLGSPQLGDSTYWATWVPGASVVLLGGAVSLGAEWEVAPHHWRAQEWRAGGTLALGRGIAVTLRADLAPNLRRRALAVALTWSAPQARLDAFTGLSGSLNQVNAFGASGALVALSTQPRR